ncbi:transcription termination factor 1 isoform X2 [Bufo bufo]|uniref:transcription termination factor 1 isoform X2 n=1 Tax=Bufo bufo TaxID=8384 RepID=UPI001ABDB1A5|nr:transcription termination factor 1 isoform X2 [Bufo bufo]
MEGNDLEEHRTMSENPGRKRKERDGASDPNAPDHVLSGPQSQAAGHKGIRKKRKILNLDFMYLGDSDTENKQGSETQEEAADDITADDAVSSNELYQEHNEKLKKSHKTKDSKRHHGDEAPSGEHTDLESRPKKKKKELKKDHEERLLEDLAEESLTADIQHAVRKKIRRQDSGGLQGGDDGSHRQQDFPEEPFSQGNNPDGSETAKQVDIKKKKKKKKRKDGPELEDDITAGETSSIVLHQDHKEKLKKSHKSKYLKTLCGGEDLPKPSVKKKPKKDCREHLLEEEESSTPDVSEKKTKRKDGGDEHHRLHGFDEGPVTTEQGSKSIDQAEDCLVEELLISETQHVSKKKKKRKDDGEKHHRLHGFSEELVTKRKHQDGSETTEQVIESIDQAENLVEESSISETQHVSKKKKKKRKDGGGLQDDGFNERLVSQLECPEGSENPEQVDENIEQIEKPVKKKKKKKKRKDEPHQEGDGLLVDNPSSSVGLPGDEASYREHTEAEDRISRKKKKSKKDQWERPLVDVEECEKNKIKRKDGGGDGSRQQRHQGGAETTDQVDERMGLAEKPVKMKKIKVKPHQVADGLAVDNVSFSLGLHGADPLYGEGTETGDGSRRKKKKKSKEDQRQQPLEDVEESWTSDPQHKSKKKTKEKDGGGKNNRRDEFIVSKRKHEGGSESPERMVDQAEERVKKKKKKRSDRMEETSEILTEEMQLEGGEAPEVNQPYQGQAVERGGNVEGDAEEDTGQTSSRRRDRPETPAPPDDDQNQDKTIQNEGDNRSTTSDENTEKAKKKMKKSVPFTREKDVALVREFFPKISNPRLSFIVQSHEIDRIRAAKQKGIMFRSGKFTNEEDEQIKENVQRFMTEVGIDSAVILFHTYKYPDLKNTITDLKRKFHFHQRIAVGLHRLMVEVHNRGIRLFDPSPIRGRYTDQEVQQLKKYCEIYDNNWPTIGALMNRSHKDSQLKASQLRREVNTGKWSIAETNRLIAAVKTIVLKSLRKCKNTSEEPVTVPKEMLYKGISWVKVEEKVETRNWTHCKIKWFTFIMMRMNYHIHPFKGALGILNHIKIIKWFHESGVKDYCDVKWDELCDLIGNVPNTIVQNKFVRLKRLIAGWEILRLSEIVDYLYSNILPKYEDQLAMANEKPIAPEKKTEFLISDMFEECSELHDSK